MSDHIDGPRATADPSIDTTDLFAFNRSDHSGKTVLAATFFPFAGERSLFSNAAIYNFVVCPVQVAGLGKNAEFKVYGQPLRFSFEFDVLMHALKEGDALPAQKGQCTLPNGEIISILVGDESGSTSRDNQTRVFAGLRSDPLYLGWDFINLKKTPNLLQEDNVLGIVIELNLKQYFPESKDTLFGIVSETVPRSRNSFATRLPRYDWVGRPEQTNFIFSMLPDVVDIKDLWNQQEPFGAIESNTFSIFHNYMTKSLQFWDMRDHVRNWDDDALAAHSRIRLNDFLLIDAAKPTNDQSHLEIEKRAIEGLSHQTGGGRTLNANSIDILVTYLINRDKGDFYQGGAKQATKPGTNLFPYLASPNTHLLSVKGQVNLKADSQTVWKLISDFGGTWHPLIAEVGVVGSGVGQLRKIVTIDGKMIVEQLSKINDTDFVLEYSLISGIPASRYQGVMSVIKTSGGCEVTWTISYRPVGEGKLNVYLLIDGLIQSGLAALKEKFNGASK